MHGALGVCAGLDPVTGGACGAASGALGGAVGSAVGGLFADAGLWVVSGAVWLMNEVGRAMTASTAVELDATWFKAHEAVMAGLAAAVVVPMVCCAAIQAVYRQSPSMLVRSFLVYLPLSVLLTGVAVTLVRLALAVTDALSAQVMGGAGASTSSLFTDLAVALAGGVGGPAPGFAVFAGGLLVAAGALVLWLELVVRAAAVSAAVLFLPLALAALVWPAVSHWCRRLADTLVALILSKLVVAAVLSLGVAALAGGGSSVGTGQPGGFAAVVTGIALLLLATLSPFTLLRLVPAVEAGAIAHLEGLRHRAVSSARSSALTGADVARDLSRRGDGSGHGSADTGAVGTSGARTVAGVVAGVGGDVAGAGVGAGAGGGAVGGTGAAAPLEPPALNETTWEEAGRQVAVAASSPGTPQGRGDAPSQG